MKKAKYSFKDYRGVLWVACIECTRGYNGLYEDKCSCGQKKKYFAGSGCFNGKLLEGMEVK